MERGEEVPNGIETEEDDADDLEDEDDAELEDDTDEDDSDSEDDDDGDSSVDSAGGSGAAGEGDDEEPGAAAGAESSLTGQALLEALRADPVAQRLMQTSLVDMINDRQAQAAAAAEAKDFSDLIDKGDMAEVGRRVVERMQTNAARTEVADAVLKEQFTPVYEVLYAQPEMQKLSAEEREALNPEKYRSDAHYVIALQDFISAKRHNAAIEAEVERRLTARAEAGANRNTAVKAQGRSNSGITPAPSGSVEPKLTSAQRITAGLRRLTDPDSIDSEDE